MLVLWMVPGYVVLLMVRRDVRKVLGLPRSARVEPPESIWADVARDAVGPLVFLAILIGWPVVLVRRRWVAEQAAHHPHLFLRQTGAERTGRVVAITIALMVATTLVLLLVNR